MPLHAFFNPCKKNQTAYHNLCTTLTPPPGTDKLLWLGLKFCIQKPLPKPDFDQYFERLTRDVRLAYTHGPHSDPNKVTLSDGRIIDLSEDNYNPKLYIKLSDHAPKEAPPVVEEALHKFKEGLQNLIQQNKPKKKHNLSKPMRLLLSQLKQLRDFIIIESDKNLGPVIMERLAYKQRSLLDHLLDTNTHEQLTLAEATSRLAAATAQVLALVKEFEEALTEDEVTYFCRSYRLKHRMAQFRITAKVHKSPYKTRPIVSDVGSPMSYLSKFLDYYLQKVVHLCPGYLRDSQSLIRDLNNLGTLPPSAHIVVADAVSMYTNIDIDYAIHMMGLWFDHFKPQLPKGYPVQFILRGLKMVMSNNVFQFDDTYWHQLSGTAMGTSVACMFATICHSMHEIATYLRKYLRVEPTPTQMMGLYDAKPILLYKRYIDDCIQIWDLDLLPAGLTTHNLQKTLAKDMEYSKLKWKINAPAKTADFLDLTVTLEPDGTVSTKTYIKPNNLHLYIPPHSAHSKGVLKSLIFGTLQRYYYQNTKSDTFVEVTRDFYNHLTNRGYEDKTLLPLFMEAGKHIADQDDKKSCKPHTKPPQKHTTTQLFIHWEYHPTDIARQKIQSVYQETAGPVFKSYLGVDKLTVAYHNPKNLRRCLTKTQLDEPAGDRVSSLVEQLKSTL